MLSRKKARTIPASCVDLELEAARRELIRTGSNVSAAPRSLGLPTRDLRVFLYAKPELLDAALEAEELALDEALEVVLATMRTWNMRRRVKAEGFLLRNTEAGRRRSGGCRPRSLKGAR
jgi:hypothetical protein